MLQSRAGHRCSAPSFAYAGNQSDRRSDERDRASERASERGAAHDASAQVRAEDRMGYGELPRVSGGASHWLAGRIAATARAMPHAARRDFSAGRRSVTFAGRPAALCACRDLPREMREMRCRLIVVSACRISAQTPAPSYFGALSQRSVPPSRVRDRAARACCRFPRRSPSSGAD